jgi:hypothetical protein
LATEVSLTSGAARAAAIGLALALFLSVPGAVASAGFVARLGISPALIAFALAGTIGAVLWSDGVNAVRTLAIATVILAVCLGVSAPIVDVTFDGQTYHQTAVRFLAEGWNPVWAVRLHEHDVSGLYLTNLPKSAWVLEAMVYRATGSFEAAKGIQLAGILAAFLLMWPALETWRITRGSAILVAALAAANPVSLTQVASFYVDGLVASSLIVLIALVILWLRTGERRWIPALILTAAFLANLKFNGILFELLVGVAAGGWVWWRARSRAREALMIVAAATVVTTLVGINPYVTNTVLYGNPAYPALGRGAMHAVVHYDTTFARQPRVVQLFRALASESSNIDERPPQLKVPLTVRASEISAFGTVDTRIGGLGPLFGGALLIAWALLAYAVARGRPGAWPLALLSLYLFCSALAIPFGYYSRYAPQLWFAALPALLIEFQRRAAVRILALLLACNTLLVGSVSLATQLFVGAVQRDQLRTIARDAAGAEITYAQVGWPFLNVDLRFAAYGIRHRAVQEATCREPALLLATHALVCLPDNRSPAPTPDPARVATAWLRSF